MCSFYSENICSDFTQLSSNLNDDIYDAIVTQGVTPASKNYADLVTAIGTLANNKYAAGAATGRKFNCGAVTGKDYVSVNCGFTPSYIAFWSNNQITVHGYGGNRSIVKNGSDWTYSGGDHASPYSGGFTAFISNGTNTIYWFAVA